MGEAKQLLRITTIGEFSFSRGLLTTMQPGQALGVVLFVLFQFFILDGAAEPSKRGLFIALEHTDFVKGAQS